MVTGIRIIATITEATDIRTIVTTNGIIIIAIINITVVIIERIIRHVDIIIGRITTSRITILNQDMAMGLII